MRAWVANLGNDDGLKICDQAASDPAYERDSQFYHLDLMRSSDDGRNWPLNTENSSFT